MSVIRRSHFFDGQSCCSTRRIKPWPKIFCLLMQKRYVYICSAVHRMGPRGLSYSPLATGTTCSVPFLLSQKVGIWHFAQKWVLIPDLLVLRLRLMGPIYFVFHSAVWSSSYFTCNVTLCLRSVSWAESAVTHLPFWGCGTFSALWKIRNWLLWLWCAPDFTNGPCWPASTLACHPSYGRPCACGPANSCLNIFESTNLQAVITWWLACQL